MNKIAYIVLLIVTFSCKKEEIPVEKHVPGDSVINSFDMGSDYKYQAFFDLKTNSFVSQNLKISWDLGFESGVEGKHIILNSANAMRVARASNAAFNSVTDTIGLVWKWDPSSGNLDSTAVGDWQSGNFVYVVDRGNDDLGVHRGFFKLKFNSVTASAYSFKMANLNGALEADIVIEKDNNVNFTAFSLSEKTTKQIEPPKSNWDIQFTQYIHFFDFYLGVENENYLVTGVLTNRNGVQVTEVFEKSYESISSEDILSADFQSRLNVIGFGWKDFNFSTGIYAVFPEKNYIIKSTEGIYFKIHFIDFYNEQGERGTPVFEFQEL